MVTQISIYKSEDIHYIGTIDIIWILVGAVGSTFFIILCICACRQFKKQKESYSEQSDVSMNYSVRNQQLVNIRNNGVNRAHYNQNQDYPMAIYPSQVYTIQDRVEFDPAPPPSYDEIVKSRVVSEIGA